MGYCLLVVVCWKPRFLGGAISGISFPADVLGRLDCCGTIWCYGCIADVYCGLYCFRFVGGVYFVFCLLDSFLLTWGFGILHCDYVVSCYFWVVFVSVICCWDCVVL